MVLENITALVWVHQTLQKACPAAVQRLADAASCILTCMPFVRPCVALAGCSMPYTQAFVYTDVEGLA